MSQARMVLFPFSCDISMWFACCRHHRYIFEEKKPGKAAKEDMPKVGARLQELGPRFTLKLRSLQVGKLPHDKLPQPLREIQTDGHVTLYYFLHCRSLFLQLEASWGLVALQAGTFDSKEGEFEFVHKPRMNVNRRRFVL